MAGLRTAFPPALTPAAMSYQRQSNAVQGCPKRRIDPATREPRRDPPHPADRRHRTLRPPTRPASSWTRRCRATECSNRHCWGSHWKVFDQRSHLSSKHILYGIKTCRLFKHIATALYSVDLSLPWNNFHCNGKSTKISFHYITEPKISFQDAVAYFYRAAMRHRQ